MGSFKLVSDFETTPAQEKAAQALAQGIEEGKQHQVLLGITGSGKTFTVANVIERIQRPSLVISHNKTLAAQLYVEFREFFPDNAVEFFVSYYDYYQPEAYVPSTDTYVEKNATINSRIERLRLSASSSLIAREDVIVVASVSCIYGIGPPDTYRKMTVHLTEGEEIEREAILEKLVAVYYERNDFEFANGTFRVRGDIIDIFPGYDECAVRVELFGSRIESISVTDPVTGEKIAKKNDIFIFPATHFVAEEDAIERAVTSIRRELDERCAYLKKKNLLLEEQRLRARTEYDIEMLEEVGYCPGIENYSRHINQRRPGEKPYSLLDYFPEDFLCIIDESHATLPQLKGMYRGDRSRKETLVMHGFRLPSALDNRPLTFEECSAYFDRALYISATPGDYERELAGKPVELVVRPTGLMDPVIDIRPTEGQIRDLLQEIRKRSEQNERVLVTTLTKRMAEDLSSYIREEGIRGEYLHSEIDTIQRIELLKHLRKGDFDVLVGVNLLREGLDLPEVSLVAIMDADREGFLRSSTSLIQTIGRTARNINASVIMYADSVTDSMKQAVEETRRRRDIQHMYNKKHNITPSTIQKGYALTLEEILVAEQMVQYVHSENEDEYLKQESIHELEEKMLKAADELRFEDAALLRDRIEEIRSG